MQLRGFPKPNRFWMDGEQILRARRLSRVAWIRSYPSRFGGDEKIIQPKHTRQFIQERVTEIRDQYTRAKVPFFG